MTSLSEVAKNSQALDAAVEAAIDACDGDARAAVRALIIANDYLEMELKRLTKTVSSGFTRGPPKGKEQPVLARSHDDRADERQDVDRRFPHHVDLVPPREGFSEAVENEITRVLETLSGTYELFVDLRGDELLERYCFACKDDAAAFQAALAGAAVEFRLKRAG